MSDLNVIMAIAAIAAPLIGSGAVLWYQQREFTASKKAVEGIKARMDCFEKAQHACQLENATNFATKDDVAHIWERVDENTRDIATIKGQLGAGNGGK